MKRSAYFKIMFFTLFLSSPTLFAASPWTEKESYIGKSLGKLEFGMANILGGWMELFTKSDKEHGDLPQTEEGANPFASVGVNAYHAMVYTAGGVFHTATFLIPVDLPLPNNGVSIE